MDFSQLHAFQWGLLLFTAFIQGMSKGGIPGLAVMAIPIVAMVVPGKASTGLVLPMLIVGDLFALAYWRRSVSIRDLLRAMPWAVLGVVAGWWLLGRINDAQMKPLVGATVLFILAMNLWRKRVAQKKTVDPTARPVGLLRQHVFPVFMGSLGGVTTMLANAAGPVISAYLLSLKLTKETFLGTSAWFFFIINWVKVPFMIQQQMITPGSLRVNLMLVPALVLGVVVGVLVAKRINQRVFEVLVTTLAAIASLRLLF